MYPALWTVALTVPRRRAWPAAAGTAPAVAAAELFFYGETMFDGEPLYAAVTVLAAMWWGESVRARRAYVAELQDRAERAERTREEEARRRVDEERLRIARELHDVVSHTIGVISVQAGVAAHLLHRRPDQAADSLAAIRQASDEALGELHAMLGVLREARRRGTARRGPAGPGARPGRAGRPGRPGGRRRGGGPVSLAGGPRRLPPAVDLACYRVVQESLTNVVRHAGASRPRSPSPTTTAGWWSRSSTTAGRSRLRRRVVLPTGRSATAPEAGIVGMRERARSLGGSWTPAPGPGAASASWPASRWDR